MGDECLAAPTSPVPPHVLLVSFPGQGHVNPLLRLAKRIAAKGLLVTVSSTAAIGRKIAASAGVPGDGIPVGTAGGRLRLEFLNDGLHSDDLDETLHHLETKGPPALAELIARNADEGRPVSCVVGNCFLPWAVDVAASSGIPSAVLWVQNCAVFSIYLHAHRGKLDVEAATVLHLPGVPPLAVEDIPTFLLPTNPFTGLTRTILSQFSCLEKASWVFANSFEELECDVIRALDDLGAPVIPVGPLIDGGADLLPADDHCIDWLDKHPRHSVVYVSLGSIVKLPEEEMLAMAEGLQSANQPFLWVVRPDSRSLLPDGFVEATARDGKSMVVEWCRQEQVLAHEATGCFLTHCGWNSSLETLAAGVPVIALPNFGDQVTDAKFFVDVWRVGVRLRSPVTSGAVREAVEAVIAGPEATGMRERAAKLREKARAAGEEGGSSDRNVEAFVEELRRRACGGGHRGA